MNIKVSVFIATSLDGFIARKDGGLDWLDEANATVPDGEDCGFQAFMESVDTLIMGRKTYDSIGRLLPELGDGLLIGSAPGDAADGHAVDRTDGTTTRGPARLAAAVVHSPGQKDKCDE